MDIRNRFKFSFFIGIAIFLVISFLEASPKYQLLSAIIVLIYGVSCMKSPQGAHEGAADSVYYLGFLFTLFSLIVSLLPPVIQNVSLDAAKVLTAFSVALSTTFIGLIFRVLIVQDIEFADDELEDSNRKVIDATNQLVIKLNLVTSQLDETNKAVHGSFTSLAEELDNVAGDFSKKASTTLDSIIDKILETSDGYMDSFSKNQDNINASLELTIESITRKINAYEASVQLLNNSSTQAAISLESLKNAGQNIELGLNGVTASWKDDLDANMKTLLGAFDSTLSDIVMNIDSKSRKFSNVLNNVEMMSNSYEGVSSQLDKLHYKFEEQAENLLKKVSTVSQNTDEIIELSQGITSLTSTIDSFKSAGEALSKVSQQIESDLEVTTEMNSKLNTVVLNNVEMMSNSYEGVSSQLDKLHYKFEEQAENLLKKVSTVSQNTDEIIELSQGITSLTSTIDSFKSAGEALSKVSQQIESDLEVTTEMNSKLNTAILSNSSKLIEHLAKIS